MTCITKKRRQNMLSCATVQVPRLPWPPPGSERRRASAGRKQTKKKTKKRQTYSPVPQLAARLPRPWPSTEWGGSAGQEKRKEANKQTKGTTPGPALSGGIGRTREKKRRNEGAQPNYTRDAPNPDIQNSETPEATQGQR